MSHFGKSELVPQTIWVNMKRKKKISYNNQKRKNFCPNNYLDNNSYGGIAIIKKDNIKYHSVGNFNKEYLQVSTVALEEKTTKIIRSSIYYPCKYIIKFIVLK